MRPPPSALLIDLYQLVMAQAYYELGMHEMAVFELFVRRLPRERRFLIAAGLEQALAFVESLEFSAEDIDYLSSLGSLSDRFLEYLRGVQFTGTVHAMPEGTPFFANEPLLRVTAPILEAQLIESRILNICHFQTLIASKAARIRLAAQSRRLIDFGMRRAHEADAALLAARAAYLAGFDATATVEAGRCFGMPLAGTLAHSFIEAHDRETDALRNFLMSTRGATTLLLDTYDTERAAKRTIALAAELQETGQRVEAVRIDSGDLAAQARVIRSLFDAAGHGDIKIVASGGLDEYAIERLLAAEAPIDAFGVGTALDASTDAAALDMAYKLQWYAGKARRKRSTGKATWPGAKQVFRERDAAGSLIRDRIALADESSPGEPLLQQVMQHGRRIAPTPSLVSIREHCRRQIGSLASTLRELPAIDEPFSATVSASVRELAARLDENDA
jgi:nicotinate phosphoribosyltransferase